MKEEMRKLGNEKRLKELHPNVRAKVQAVLKDLEGHGFKPYIPPGSAWRSPAEQLQKFNEGKSKVRYSFHNCTGPRGEKEALAADIVDAQLLWGASTSFWLLLGSSALAHGLTWGGLWGLTIEERVRVKEAIALKRWEAKPKLGWDTAHVETRMVTLDEAKAGKR